MEYTKLVRGKLTFISFTELDEECLREILNWRNHDAIRSQMNTSEIIPWEAHKAYCYSLMDKKDVLYWLIERNSKPCGVVYLRGMENGLQIAEWGYYSSPQYLGTGIGLEMAYEAIKLFFNVLDVRKLHGFIKTSNRENQRIQQAIGFSIGDTIINNGIELVDTLLDEDIPENNYREFQKRLLYGRKD